jgi:enamine deaminase RidA (YjgF/YER057c/UK114 family)
MKQKSPYRYGSAFSRSIIIRDNNLTYIMLSGTAAIDDQGKSLYPGDTRAQTRKTIDVVEALIAKEGGKLRDICEATAFLKRAEDISIYDKVIAEYGLENMPAICVVADVCRDELLFELDALVSFYNTSSDR